MIDTKTTVTFINLSQSPVLPECLGCLFCPFESWARLWNIISGSETIAAILSSSRKPPIKDATRSALVSVDITWPKACCQASCIFCGDFRLHKGHKSYGSLLVSEFIPKTITRSDTDGVSEQVHKTSHNTILFSLFSDNDIFGGIDVVTSFNILNPTSDFTYHQVQHSRILRGAHIAFKYSVWISEQTSTFLCTI